MKKLKALAMVTAVAAVLAAAPTAVLATEPTSELWTPGVYPNCQITTLRSMVDLLVDNGPGVAGDVWQDATNFSSNNFEAGFAYLTLNNVLARSKFNQEGYDACQAKSAGAGGAFDTIVVYPTNGLNASSSVGWPVLIYRPQVTDASGAASRVILSIPHAKTEADLHDDLVVEAIQVAEDEHNKLAVRAAVISTVDRCHSDTVMPTNAPYWGTVDRSECNYQMRLSDDAHAANSVFQKVHYAVRKMFAQDQVVQIHGAGDNFGGISVSNGSGDLYAASTTDDRGHAVVRAYDELTLLADDDAEFTICHSYTPIDGRTRPANYFQTQNRRCGTNNATRGEDYGFAADLASGAPGFRQFHFVHLEVDGDLKELPEDRALIIGALGRMVEDN